MKLGGGTGYVIDCDRDGVLGTAGDGVVVPGCRTIAPWCGELWTPDGAVALTATELAKAPKAAPIGMPHPEDADHAAGWRHLEWRRQQVAVRPVAYDASYEADMRAHAAYIALNGGGLTHDETKGSPGYSEAGAAAGIACSIGTASSCVDGFEQQVRTLFHRHACLNAVMERSTMVLHKGIWALRVHGADSTRLSDDVVVFPSHGMTGVEPAFLRGGENPMPLAVPNRTPLGLAIGVRHASFGRGPTPGADDRARGRPVGDQVGALHGRRPRRARAGPGGHRALRAAGARGLRRDGGAVVGDDVSRARRRPPARDRPTAPSSTSGSSRRPPPVDERPARVAAKWRERRAGRKMAAMTWRRALLALLLLAAGATAFFVLRRTPAAPPPVEEPVWTVSPPPDAPAGAPFVLGRAPRPETVRWKGTFSYDQVPSGNFGAEPTKPRRALAGTFTAVEATSGPASARATGVDATFELEDRDPSAASARLAFHARLSFNARPGGRSRASLDPARGAGRVRTELELFQAAWAGRFSLPVPAVRVGQRSRSRTRSTWTTCSTGRCSSSSRSGRRSAVR